MNQVLFSPKLSRVTGRFKLTAGAFRRIHRGRDLDLETPPHTKTTAVRRFAGRNSIKRSRGANPSVSPSGEGSCSFFPTSLPHPVTPLLSISSSIATEGSAVAVVLLWSCRSRRRPTGAHHFRRRDPFIRRDRCLCAHGRVVRT